MSHGRDLILRVVGFLKEPQSYPKTRKDFRGLQKIFKGVSNISRNAVASPLGKVAALERSHINSATALERTIEQATETVAIVPIATATQLRKIQLQAYKSCYSSEYVSLENLRTGQVYYHRLPKPYFSHYTYVSSGYS